MALVIEARLLQGRYDAADRSGRRAEWPPHPARLFCALVSVAGSEAERAALRWLEGQGPPQVWAAGEHRQAHSKGYVVTNKTSPKGGSQQWPGRTSTERARVAALPAAEDFAVVWPQAQGEAGTVQTLADLAWKVPYLGRSSSPAALRVHTAPTARPQWQEWEPARLNTANAVQLRAPYSGYLAALDTAFEQGEPADSVARSYRYLARAAEQEPSPAGEGPVGGPFRRMLVFAPREGTHRPSGVELLRFTQALRGAVLSRLGQAAAPQITGHAGDGQRHLAFWGLVDVGHVHARGHLLGVALGVPDDLEPAALAQLQQLAADPLRLVMGRDGVWELEHVAWPSSPWRLVPESWSGGSRGQRQWVSATPVMLDRHPRPNRELGPMVADSFERAGYPRPERVETSAAPMLPGGLHRPAPGTYPPNRPRRKVVHARVCFPEPVCGPVAVGSLRYFGLGLFAPERLEEEQ